MTDQVEAGSGPAGPSWWPADPTPWEVVDRGASVDVGGLRPPWAFWVVVLVVLVPFAWFFGGGTDGWFRGMGPVLVALAGGSAWLSMRDLTFLHADGHGLRVRTTFIRREVRVVPWDEVAGFRATKVVSVLPNEEWFVVTTTGEQLRIVQLAAQRGWHRHANLGQVIGGVAQFPTRFGRPPLLLDLGPSGPSGAYGHLPPPPAPS